MEKHQPVQTYLRSSGSIWQDANRVLLMWMPPKTSEGLDQKDSDPIKEIEMIQDKCRFGPKGIKLALEFTGPYTHFARKNYNENRNF